MVLLGEFLFLGLGLGLGEGERGWTNMFIGLMGFRSLGAREGMGMGLGLGLCCLWRWEGEIDVGYGDVCGQMNRGH